MKNRSRHLFENLRRTAAIFLLLGVATQQPLGASEHGGRAGPSVVVVGTGDVAGLPDTVEFQVGATTTARSAAKALSENSEVLSAIQKVLSEHGLEQRNIQTVRFDVSPEYERDNTGRQAQVTGYRVTHILRVRHGDLEAVGGLLDKLLGVGANLLNSIQFLVADPAPLLTRAREMAVAHARSKATTLAQAAGLELGAIRRISEGAAAGPGPIMLSEMRMAAAPIASGQQSFTVSVTVIFALD